MFNYTFEQYLLGLDIFIKVFKAKHIMQSYARHCLFILHLFYKSCTAIYSLRTCSFLDLSGTSRNCQWLLITARGKNEYKSFCVSSRNQDKGEPWTWMSKAYCDITKWFLLQINYSPCAERSTIPNFFAGNFVRVIFQWNWFRLLILM